MTAPRITLLKSQEKELHSWLTGHPDGHERGAMVLFRQFDRYRISTMQSPRYVAVDIIKMCGDWIISSSPTRLKFNMRKLPELYFRCERENLELGFIHWHPNGFLGFSGLDDTNEQNILKGYSGSNGDAVSLISLVYADNQWCGRIRSATSSSSTRPLKHISVLGKDIELYGISGSDNGATTLMRQEAAFGKPFNTKLQSMRAVVAGAGGTGSSLATLLARAGIGELIIIDGDKLEDTNLNRVRGYRTKDIGKSKAEILSDFIESLGLSCNVSYINAFLDKSPDAIDALSSADIVFGCTDDVFGREILNHAVYFYGLPYIDVGLTGKIDTDEKELPYLRDHRGRVSCILPEAGACLRCQRVVTDEKLNYEQAVKDKPELAELDPETLKKEYYLVGGGEQAPGVGPFVSASADFAIATFMNLLRPYRKLPSDLRPDNIWVDFVHMCIHSNEPYTDPSCIFCQTHDILLADEQGSRLGMPRLGSYNQASAESTVYD